MTDDHLKQLVRPLLRRQRSGLPSLHLLATLGPLLINLGLEIGDAKPLGRQGGDELLMAEATAIDVLRVVLAATLGEDPQEGDNEATDTGDRANEGEP